MKIMVLIHDIVTLLGLLLLIVGGCGLMDPAGDIQPLGVVFAIFGGVLLLIEGRIHPDVKR